MVIPCMARMFDPDHTYFRKPLHASYATSNSLRGMGLTNFALRDVIGFCGLSCVSVQREIPQSSVD